jgi:hypothetical protein
MVKTNYSKHGRQFGSKKSLKVRSLSPSKGRNHFKTLSDMQLHILNVIKVHGIEIDIKPFFKLCTNVQKNEGYNGLLIKMKAWRLYLQQYMLSQKLTYPPYTKAGQTGHPKILESFILIIDTYGVNGCRLVLSIFRCIELIKLKPKYDYDTITSQKTGESAKYAEFLQEFELWLKTWKGLRLLPNLGTPVYPVSSSRGPNTNKDLPYGKSILAVVDYSALIGTSILEGCKFFLDKFYDLSIIKTIPGKYVHSKLVSLSDKAGKERIIAMGDIISSWALSPMEIAFQSALRQLRSSVVGQNHNVHRIINSMGKNLYSVDLSAMTDRLPRQLNYLVVKARYGESIADNWISVLADRTFKSHIGEIRYEVGNPMGLLSSWSSSTFVHHAFVEFIHYKCNINNKRFISNFKYLILGDDLLVNSKTVYNFYIKMMTEVIGIQISTNKCTISNNGSCEFTKRLFLKGTEVTGFPVELYRRSKHEISSFISLLHMLEQRGYNLRDPVFMDKLTSGLNKKTLKHFEYSKRLPINILKLPHSVWCSPTIFITDETCIKNAMLNLVKMKFEELTEYKCKLSILKHKDLVLVPEYHPILITVGEEVFKLLQDTAVHNENDPSGEFSIWYSWEDNVVNNFKVDYFEIPSLYPSGRNVIKRQRRRKQIDPILIKLIKQDNESLEGLQTGRISNVELFELSFR